MTRRSPIRRAPRRKFGESKQWSVLWQRHFDSRAECAYAARLYARQQDGEITDVEFQRTWHCEINGVRIGRRHMRLDFRWTDDSVTGGVVWCDVKPCRRWRSLFPTWSLKADFWAAGGPGPLLIVWPQRQKIEPWASEIIWPAGQAGEYIGL